MKKFFSALFRHIFDFITLLVFSVVIVPPFLALNAPAWLLAAATLLYPLAFNYLPTATTIADIILWIVGLVWFICGKTLFLRRVRSMGKKEEAEEVKARITTDIEIDEQ